MLNSLTKHRYLIYAWADKTFNRCGPGTAPSLEIIILPVPVDV